MRISDWSSDVCSSDLIDDERAAPCLDDWLDQRLNAAHRRKEAGIDPMPRQYFAQMFVDSYHGGRVGRGAKFTSNPSSRERVTGRVIPPMTLNAHCRSEEHTSELQSLMRISYAVFCLKKKKNISNTKT